MQVPFFPDTRAAACVRHLAQRRVCATLPCANLAPIVSDSRYRKPTPRSAMWMCMGDASDASFRTGLPWGTSPSTYANAPRFVIGEMSRQRSAIKFASPLPSPVGARLESRPPSTRKIRGDAPVSWAWGMNQRSMSALIWPVGAP